MKFKKKRFKRAASHKRRQQDTNHISKVAQYKSLTHLWSVHNKAGQNLSQTWHKKVHFGNPARKVVAAPILGQINLVHQLIQQDPS